MEPSCKYLSPTQSSDPKDAPVSIDYTRLYNNNNSIFSIANHTNGLMSPSNRQQPAHSALDNNLQQQHLHSPQLSPNNSSLSSHNTLHPYDAANDFVCANTKPTTTNQQQHQASPANSSYNSSFGSNSGRKLITDSVVPGGVVTTQNISTVIRPRSNNNSLQFVKIKTPESSIKAVEQVRLAEENKISKDKIKEVEEEWQNNLLNWKSKRRQQFSHSEQKSANNNSMFGGPDENACGAARKVKTFAEMIEERAKSGNRLGFHLQRYIGAEEDEEEQELSTPAHGNCASMKQDTQNKHQVVDSDDYSAEAHSSTSSGNSDLGDKILPAVDPTPPPRTTTLNQNINKHNSNQPLRNIPSQPRETFPDCDNSHLEGSAKLEHRDETDNLHSISLVGHPLQADQLSSTLRPIDNDNSNHVSLTSQLNEVKAKINALRPTNEASSDDSVYEEDEEEEEEEHEEQKHLQRIAFEAKLKAFERLTQSTSAPANKHVLVKPKPQPKPTTLGKSPMQSDHDSRLESVRSQAAEMRLRTIIEPQEPQAEPEVERVEETTTQETQIAAPMEYKQQERQLTPTPSPFNTQLQQDAIKQLPPQPPVPVQRPLPNRLNLPPPATIELMNPTDYASVRAQAPMDSPPQSPAKEQGFNSSSILSNVNHTDSSPLDAQLTPPPPPLPPTQAQSIQREESSFKSQLPSSRRPPKEDKDRTVLSVSGKKRCSSCKEELGRGAAAFVVESLGLVYHTNCFRCSVCHVNLSNGFRGVDVRVHAGALHCQNCYSKDGLNYSRV